MQIFTVFIIFFTSLFADSLDLILTHNGERSSVKNIELNEKGIAEVSIKDKNGKARILKITITEESSQQSMQESDTILALDSTSLMELSSEKVLSIKDKNIIADATSSPYPYRRYYDLKSFFSSFLGIVPHNFNYILPLNHSINARDGEKNSEVKFQISFKAPLATKLLGTKLDLYLGYTQRSFWQIYDEKNSRPFRESNYEPELFLSYPVELPLFSGRLEQINFGINHESNGGDSLTSRSWNRAFIEGIYNNGGLLFALKAWYRMGEHDKAYPYDSRGDDNPDITDFLGHGEVRVGYLWGKNLITATLRNNLKSSNNRGSILLDYSYPLQNNLHLYLQAFSGYGESLIDYNKSVERIGVGFLLTR
ncbi:MAG: phospholipase A [Wolinella sp.]